MFLADVPEIAKNSHFFQNIVTGNFLNRKKNNNFWQLKKKKGKILVVFFMASFDNFLEKKTIFGNF